MVDGSTRSSGLTGVALALLPVALVAQVAPVPVTVGPYSAVETAIAIDPSNPDHIVGASIQTLGDPSSRHITNFSYVSWDGGRSWTTVALPNAEDRVQGDDGVAIDHEGRVYRSYIAFKHLRDPKGIRPTTGIYVAMSEDGGITYHAPVAVVDHVNTIVPFEDKPWVTADLSPTSPYRGNLYVAWTRFTEYGSTAPSDSSFIFFATSRDHGQTFTRPLRIPAQGGDAVDSDGTVEGAVPAVGPNGEVYLAWGGPRGIEFTRSMDAGANWDPARTVLDQPGGWDIGITGVGRANGMPVTGADVSNGPHRGTLYINWVDLRNNDGKDGDADVFVARSSDLGATWSAPVRVNGDRVHDGRDQFFTWMSVDPTDGSVNVVYYDRRTGDGTGIDVYLARSTDGGRTFTERRVSPASFHPVPNRFFGDYIGISAFAGRTAALWVESRMDTNVLKAVVVGN